MFINALVPGRQFLVFIDKSRIIVFKRKYYAKVAEENTSLISLNAFSEFCPGKTS